MQAIVGTAVAVAVVLFSFCAIIDSNHRIDKMVNDVSNIKQHIIPEFQHTAYFMSNWKNGTFFEKEWTNCTFCNQFIIPLEDSCMPFYEDLNVLPLQLDKR